MSSTTTPPAPPVAAPVTGPGTDAAAGPVTAVIFDYGNVLYTWDAVGAVAGRVPLTTWDGLVASGEFDRLNAMSDAGAPFETILASLRQARPDHPEWVGALQTYLEHFSDTKTGPVPGATAILEDLLDVGVPLYALTNYNDCFFAQTRWMVPQLERFAGIVVSGQEHVLKPDPAIYRILLDRYDLDPSRTLFVDDSQANVEGARAAGLRAHHFRGAGRLRAELTELGLLAPRS